MTGPTSPGAAVKRKVGLTTLVLSLHSPEKSFLPCKASSSVANHRGDSTAIRIVIFFYSLKLPTFGIFFGECLVL